MQEDMMHILIFLNSFLHKERNSAYGTVFLFGKKIIFQM